MKVTQVSYTRKYNTGNYESEEYSATAVLEDDDSSVEAMVQLKEDVAAANAGAIPVTENEDVPSGKKAKKKKTAKKAKPQPEEEDEEEESSEDEDSEEETGDDDSDEEDSETDSESDDEEEEEPLPKKKVASKTGKKFKKKPQNYDRDIETHKDIFSQVLTEVSPNWKKNEATKKKAKALSAKLEGKEFLDEDGEVLPTFKKLVKMGIK